MDKRCNDLERGFNERMVRMEILQARYFPSNTLLGKVNNQKNNNEITFNITYHPVLRNVRKILEEIHMILASNDRCKKASPNFPLIGFKNDKSLKDHWVRSQLLYIEEKGRPKPCEGKRPYHLCKSMKETRILRSKHFDELYQINNYYNCNSKMTAYWIECRVCGEQYTGGAKTKFRSRPNNYKSIHRTVMHKKEVLKQVLKQKSFHEHYCTESHTGIEGWVIILIDKADTIKEFRKKELDWMYKLKTYAPCGINERDVYEAF